MPETIEAIVPSYLWRFRKTGQFSAAWRHGRQAGRADLLKPADEETQRRLPARGFGL